MYTSKYLFWKASRMFFLIAIKPTFYVPYAQSVEAFLFAYGATLQNENECLEKTFSGSDIWVQPDWPFFLL